MVTSTANIQLFRLLKQKLGESDAETLVNLMDTRFKEINEADLKMVATKEDIAGVKEEIARLETRLERKIGDVKVEIGDVKIETLRWVFGFFIVLILAIMGLYFK